MANLRLWGFRPALEARFHADLTVTQLEGKWRLWRLEEPLPYRVQNDPPCWIIVPQGFVTDGPSIPRFLWDTMPTWGPWGRAGVVHDYLCCLLSLENPHMYAPTRLACDRVFRKACLDLGVSPLVANLLYLGVRLGAWMHIRTKSIDNNRKMRDIIVASAGG